MELVFENNNKLKKNSKSNISRYWEDSLFDEFYYDYFDEMSSKELDKEFSKDIKYLSEILKKLSDSERKAFIEVLSKYIEFYIDHKVEKEIDNSLFKILNI
jgi:hypothetical protein